LTDCYVCDRVQFGKVVYLGSDKWRHEACAPGSRNWCEWLVQTIPEKKWTDAQALLYREAMREKEVKEEGPKSQGKEKTVLSDHVPAQTRARTKDGQLRPRVGRRRRRLSKSRRKTTEGKVMVEDHADTHDSFHSIGCEVGAE